MASPLDQSLQQVGVTEVEARQRRQEEGLEASQLLSVGQFEQELVEQGVGQFAQRGVLKCDVIFKSTCHLSLVLFFEEIESKLKRDRGWPNLKKR